MLGFASKDLQSKGTTSWGDIKEEVEKGLRIPVENRALKGKLRAVLVVASTQLMKEISDVIGDKLAIVLDAGVWSYHKDSGKLDKGKNTRGWEEKFAVPAHSELVVLSKSGMAALLGDGALDSLERYFTRAEDERCEDLLSLEQAIGSLVRKRKREDEEAANALKKPAVAGVAHTPIPGRTIKLTFVDSATKQVIGKGMADIPFGTMLSAAKTIIGGVMDKKAGGRVMAGLEWEGVTISDDEEMQSVQHRDEVVVLLQ